MFSLRLADRNWNESLSLANQSEQTKMRRIDKKFRGFFIWFRNADNYAELCWLWNWPVDDNIRWLFFRN